MSELGEGTAENRWSDRRIVQSFRRIAVEILIGFVGIYAAFALTAYKERRDNVERRHQLKRALVHELQPLVEVSQRNLHLYAAILTKFDSAVKAGGKPMPPTFIEPLNLNMHMWDATKQAGGLSLIDVPTFANLADFYNNWSEMAAFYGQLRDLSVNVVLPLSARGPDAFYDAKTGALRPDIRALYRQDLRSLDNLTNGSVKQGRALIAQLARDTI